MRNINSILILTGTMFASLLMFSCVKEDTVASNAYDGDLVSVNLDLNVEPLVEMTEQETKGTAINESTNIEVNEVKNLWILQFNGTTDEATRVGNPIYIENFNSTDVQKLVASSVENRLYFIANTFARNIAFADCGTLAQTKAMIRSITDHKEADVVYTETDATATPNVVKHYPLMNGYVDMTVGSGATINASLKHSVARVDIKLVNAIPSTVAIESITLKSVPDRFNYIPDYTASSLYPEVTTLQTLDYEPTLWADGESDADAESGTDTKNFTFYMPANKRGTTTEDTQGGKYKGFFSPDKATYAFITANYQEGTGSSAVPRSVTYTFYLGANLTSDYNIEPNGHYSYTFTINQKGDEESDGRVGDTGLVDFCSKGLANCYIINPPTASGSWRNYRIPIKRVYDFWKEDGKWEDDASYAEPSDGWVVDVIWSEFDPGNSTNFRWVKKNKITKLDPNNDYFEFQIKEGTQGNCIIGLRRYTNSSLTVDGSYLWSWHLWVTDYNPDKVALYTVNPAHGRYEYKVPGGNVHRYDNDIFNTGEYKGKVIMDRNLGAKDIYYHGGDGHSGDLYYQYGRKDPFAGTRNIYIRQKDGTFSYTTWGSTIASQSAGTNYNNVPYSIYNPLTFITGSYWTYNDKYNPTTFDANIRWQDPEVKTDSGKSIFDPCPNGWKVPKNGTWQKFDTKNSDAQYSVFLWNDPLSTGRNYTLNGAFYPASGRLTSGSGAVYLVGSYGYYWSSSPYNASLAYYLFFNSSYVLPSGSDGRATGFPVRCVQE